MRSAKRSFDADEHAVSEAAEEVAEVGGAAGEKPSPLQGSRTMVRGLTESSTAS